jgi:DNA-binding response OmpR family regulator
VIIFDFDARSNSSSGTGAASSPGTAAAASTSGPASTSVTENPVLSQPSKRHILVVDDEKNIRLTVQHSLVAADYEVDTASNGLEGLQKFREGHYDLILMDLRMPQINGIEMLREIRERDQETAAVVITAYLTIDTLLEAFSLGVSDYIRKPFSPNDVRETVRRVLSRERLDLQHPPTEAAGSLELARKALAKHDIEQAMTLARQAIEVNSNNPDAHAFLGILQHLSGDAHAAEQSFREALLLDPQHQLSRDYLFWTQSRGRTVH